MTRYCTKCGASNDDFAQYCERCGEKLDNTTSDRDIHKSELIEKDTKTSL